MNRQPAVAGSWYSAHPATLAREIDEYLDRAPAAASFSAVQALLAPHAGLLFSGATAAAAFGTTASRRYDAIVIVGPSHYQAFDGVAAWPDGCFGTPLGPLPVAADLVAALVDGRHGVVVHRDAHLREHSIEMELPFVRRLHPDTPIVPLVMGVQSRATVEALASKLADTIGGRDVLLVASSDLSHFFDARTAEALDARVAGHVESFDAEGLMTELERHPEADRGRFVMCGGGPAVAVMLAARQLGARDARVMARTHSGLISGDMDRVVGYMAAVFGTRIDA